MFPEEARKLLDGDREFCAWELEGREPLISGQRFAIRQQGKPGILIQGTAYGNDRYRNAEIIAAAPDAIATVANMEAEYAVIHTSKDGLQRFINSFGGKTPLPNQAAWFNTEFEASSIIPEAQHFAQSSVYQIVRRYVSKHIDPVEK